MKRDRTLTLLTLAAALAATSFPRLTRAEITTTESNLLHQAVANMDGGPEDPDRFGDEVASGDFNGDGFADLAVGATGEDVGSLNAAGAVQILPGGAGEFSGAAEQIFHEDTPA